MIGIVQRVGHRMTRWLNAPAGHYVRRTPTDARRLQKILRSGDVLLVEGDTRASGLIKYITQSTWSHAALFVGAPAGRAFAGGRS